MQNVHGKNVQIHDLPPTSSTAMGHLLRAFLHTHMQIHCLDENPQFLDPLKFGFEIVDKVLIPSKCTRLFPNDFIGACTCIKCAKSTCLCKTSQVSCCIYCKCQSVEAEKIDCRNTFT